MEYGEYQLFKIFNCPGSLEINKLFAAFEKFTLSFSLVIFNYWRGCNSRAGYFFQKYFNQKIVRQPFFLFLERNTTKQQLAMPLKLTALRLSVMRVISKEAIITPSGSIFQQNQSTFNFSE